MKSGVFKYTAAVAGMFVIACAGTMNLYFKASTDDVNAQAKKSETCAVEAPTRSGVHRRDAASLPGGSSLWR